MVRILRILCILVLIAPFTGLAYYYNDTDQVEIGSGEPKLIPEKALDSQGNWVTPGGYLTVQGGTPPPDSVPEENATVPDENLESAAQYPTENSSQNPAHASETGYESEDSSGDSASGPIDTDEELFDLLLEGGALSGDGLTAIGKNTEQGSFFRDVFSNEAITNLWGVTVEGSRVRDILSGKYSLRDILTQWRTQKGSQLNARGLGLVGASKALVDTNIDTIRFRADAFQITYRSRGYLFAIFPKSFPVTVTVVPEAREGRITVKLPWYRFFVRKFFTTNSLTGEIDVVVVNEIQRSGGSDNDIRTVLLDAVADFLKKKVGTITDSIYLGESRR